MWWITITFTFVPWFLKKDMQNLLFDHSQFALIHRSNIPGSYATLLFTALDFTSVTSHIHNWVLFLLWLRLFIHPGVISPLFSSSILGTYQPGSSSFSVLFFCLFILFMLQWITFCQNSPPWPVCLGWPYMAWLIVSLSYTKVWFLWSVWLVFCDCGFHSQGHSLIISSNTLCLIF